MSHETAQGHPADVMLDTMLAMGAATPLEVAQAAESELGALRLQVVAEAGQLLTDRLLGQTANLGANIQVEVSDDTLAQQLRIYFDERDKLEEQ